MRKYIRYQRWFTAELLCTRVQNFLCVYSSISSRAADLAAGVCLSILTMWKNKEGKWVKKDSGVAQKVRKVRSTMKITKECWSSNGGRESGGRPCWRRVTQMCLQSPPCPRPSSWAWQSSFWGNYEPSESLPTHCDPGQHTHQNGFNTRPLRDILLRDEVTMIKTLTVYADLYVRPNKQNAIIN